MPYKRPTAVGADININDNIRGKNYAGGHVQCTNEDQKDKVASNRIKKNKKGGP